MRDAITACLSEKVVAKYRKTLLHLLQYLKLTEFCFIVTSDRLKMQRITEELIRKRCEHNEREIGTLEELSLHQEDIGKLEHLQNWCRDLKILLLHSNLISKIENLGKLKKLEYVNFSLNNIEKIENLEGCESLKKLDFTLNFIGDITSAENLKKNIHLDSLYLSGNPCSDYNGYRQFVVATLPHLNNLDGKEITHSERIKAIQQYDRILPGILKQQARYFESREEQKRSKKLMTEEEIIERMNEDDSQKYWNTPSENTPEDRIELAIMSRTAKNKDNKKDENKPSTRKVKLFNKDGYPLNINEARIPFTLDDDYFESCYKLDVAVYKHLDTAFIEVDVQPNYVRVVIKGKTFQLSLTEEVSPDRSTAQRSQVTGHLLVTMPKVNQVVKPVWMEREEKKLKNQIKNDKLKKRENKTEYLEIDEEKLLNISKMLHITNNEKSTKKKDNDNFIDDPEVPPLE